MCVPALQPVSQRSLLPPSPPSTRQPLLSVAQRALRHSHVVAVCPALPCGGVGMPLQTCRSPSEALLQSLRVQGPVLGPWQLHTAALLPQFEMHKYSCGTLTRLCWPHALEGNGGKHVCLWLTGQHFLVSPLALSGRCCPKVSPGAAATVPRCVFSLWPPSLPPPLQVASLGDRSIPGLQPSITATQHIVSCTLFNAALLQVHPLAWWLRASAPSPTPPPLLLVSGSAGAQAIE